MICWFKNWLHWGCDAAASHSLKRKIFYANIVAVVTILTMLLFAILNFIIGNPALIESNLIAIPFYFTAAAVPWLNRRGQPNLASWVLSLSLTTSIIAMTGMVYGSRFGLHFYFALFAMLPVTYFPLRHWKSIFILFALNASLFIGCQFIGVASHPALLQVSDPVIMLMRVSLACAVLFSIFIMVWMGEYAADRNERELESLSGTDVLTRLPNRRRMEQRLTECIVASKRSQQHGAVIFIDLDNFKPLNDKHGHSVGDLLLQEAAQRISDCVREVDVVARYGGDEFIVILSNLGYENDDAQKHARATAEKIQATMGKPYELAIHVKDADSTRVKHRCTSSIGVAMFVGGSHNEDHILKNADTAMYCAKKKGRNTICFYQANQPAGKQPSNCPPPETAPAETENTEAENSGDENLGLRKADYPVNA